MFSGQLMNTWIDSLQAFFPGLQVGSHRVCREDVAIATGFCVFSFCDTRAFSGSSGFGRLVAQYVLIILFVRLVVRVWNRAIVSKCKTMAGK